MSPQLWVSELIIPNMKENFFALSAAEILFVVHDFVADVSI